MKRYPKIFLVCIIAEILNLISAFFFTHFLHIPLFLDTIFTVAVTFYFGLIPGLLVSLGYNFLSPFCSWALLGFLDPSKFLFSLCGIAIVIVTWLFSRQEKEFKISLPITFLYLVLIAMISSFCSIMIGGVIDYVRFLEYDLPDSVVPIKKFTEAFLQQDFGLFASCIFAQIPISFTDRLVSTLAGYGVYSLFKKFLGEAKEW